MNIKHEKLLKLIKDLERKSLISISSRAVKGVRLKILCVSFAGSNPALCTFFYFILNNTIYYFFFCATS